MFKKFMYNRLCINPTHHSSYLRIRTGEGNYRILAAFFSFVFVWIFSSPFNRLRCMFILFMKILNVFLIVFALWLKYIVHPSQVLTGKRSNECLFICKNYYVSNTHIIFDPKNHIGVRKNFRCGCISV